MVQTAYAVPNRVPDIVTALENLPAAFQNVTVYPNPASDLVMVKLADKLRLSTQWQLHDLTGKTLQIGQAHVGNNGFQFSVENLPTGVYILKAQQNGKPVMVEKVIVRP